MERVYTNYTASGRQVVLNNVPSSFASITTENIRLIFNETQKNEKGEALDPLASTGCKENILSVTYNSTAKTVTIVLADTVPVIAPIDKLTIKIDMGDGLENMGSAIIEIDNSLLALESTTAKEATIGTANDAETALTVFGKLAKIYEYLAGQTSEDIPEGLGDRINLLLQFFGLPQALTEYQPMTEQDVTDTIEDIMGSLDTDLCETVEYPEGSGQYITRAQAITAQVNETLTTNS